MGAYGGADIGPYNSRSGGGISIKFEVFISRRFIWCRIWNQEGGCGCRKSCNGRGCSGKFEGVLCRTACKVRVLGGGSSGSGRNGLFSLGSGVRCYGTAGEEIWMC